ncbi:MAG: DinB family protein [Chitinophagaceae bacterium]|nr:DinB family protein [Chitinophagaceae bacterium]
MLVSTVKKLFLRDLAKLKTEIESYQDEGNLWLTDKAITNSAGNLCLHLIGNINAYIGTEIGRTGYVRQRELEFSLKNIPRQELLTRIEKTIRVVETALDKLSEEDMHKEYPILVFAEKTSIGYFLVHLTVHLGYHLGQINYHRRIFDQP